MKHVLRQNKIIHFPRTRFPPCPNCRKFYHQIKVKLGKYMKTRETNSCSHLLLVAVAAAVGRRSSGLICFEFGTNAGRRKKKTECNGPKSYGLSIAQQSIKSAKIIWAQYGLITPLNSGVMHDNVKFQMFITNYLNNEIF